MLRKLMLAAALYDGATEERAVEIGRRAVGAWQVRIGSPWDVEAWDGMGWSGMV